MQCAECKGKGYCGLPRCPIVSRFQAQLRLVRPARSYQGRSPSLFIGNAGFPSVRGGPILADGSDSPPDWLAGHLSIDDIVANRAGTIMGKAKVGPFLPELQEIALSPVPLEVEARFEKPLSFDLAFDGTIAPVGLTGSLEALDVLDSASTERPVDRACSDTDLHASDACRLLHGSGIDVYRISRLLSAALLGSQRHVVPTRWSITAVDDMIGKGLVRDITGNASVPAVQLFSRDLFGNRIAVLLFPGPWEYEMVEIWAARSLWSGDGESVTVDGERLKKRDYSPISGAYYAARLAVAEYLKSAGRTARVIVVRYVTSEYWAPLGVWVVREAVRGAMSDAPSAFATTGEATAKASEFLGSDSWMTRSRLLSTVRTQRTLTGFL